MLQSYVKLLHEALTRYDASTNTSDISAVRALAHKLAGASGTVGAASLARQARQIDVAGKSGSLSWTSDVMDLRETIAGTLAAFTPLTQSSALQAFLDGRPTPPH